MYCPKVEAEFSEQLSSAVLAAQVFGLGLRHARPHLWDKRGHNASAPRYDQQKNIESKPANLCKSTKHYWCFGQAWRMHCLLPCHLCLDSTLLSIQH